jgi:protease YdgD
LPVSTDTDTRIPDDALTFQAGLRNGRPEALRGVRRSFVPPAYGSTCPPISTGSRRTWRCWSWSCRCGRTGSRPLATGRRAAWRCEVTVVSYGAEREAHASIEEGCLRVGKPRRRRLLSCNVVQGSSGAPVMRMTEAGRKSWP